MSDVEIIDERPLIEIIDNRHIVEVSAPGPQGPIGYVEGGVPANPEWSSILNKPTTFTPSAHTHAWTDVTGKPTTFPAEAHSHSIANVTGLQAELDSKVEDDDARLTDARTPTAHTHDWASITSKPTEFTPTAHTHDWSGITGKPSTFTPSTHSHSSSDVTGLDAALAAKLDTSQFTWTDLVGKPSTFTPSSHTHLWADLTDKPTTFAPSTHSHAQSDITGLSAALTAKADDSAVVKLTGNQTVAGVKSFSSAPKLTSTSTTGYVWTATGTDGSGSWAAAAGGGGGGYASTYLRVHASASQSITNGAWRVISFNTEDSDPGSNFASDLYTVPATGIYFVAMFVRLVDGTTATSMLFGINTTTGDPGDATVIGTNDVARYSINHAGLYSFTAGQQVRGVMYTVTNNVVIDAARSLSIVRVA